MRYKWKIMKSDNRSPVTSYWPTCQLPDIITPRDAVYPAASGDLPHCLFSLLISNYIYKQWHRMKSRWRGKHIVQRAWIPLDSFENKQTRFYETRMPAWKQMRGSKFCTECLWICQIFLINYVRCSFTHIFWYCYKGNSSLDTLAVKGSY